MEKYKLKKEFICFLKRNSAYEKYIYNFERRQELYRFYTKKSFEKYFIETPKGNLISNAFAWAVTKEQYNFWQLLHGKWKKNMMGLGLEIE